MSNAPDRIWAWEAESILRRGYWLAEEGEEGGWFIRDTPARQHAEELVEKLRWMADPNVFCDGPAYKQVAAALLTKVDNAS